jgi:hypothetical protein
MTAGVAEAAPPAEAAPRPALPRRLRRLVNSIVKRWQFLVAQASSSLTRRIVLLNLAGLFALVFSILYLSQFRAGLIDARVQSLLVQGEIIAGAIAASATVETDAITIDPDKLLELQSGESYGPLDESQSALEFPINPERVAPLLRASTTARARCCSTRAASTAAATCCASTSSRSTTGRAGSSAPGSRSRTGSAASTCRSTRSSGRPPTARTIRRSRRRSTA